MRCFIGFYGLTRSVRYTANSIHNCIYAPLKRAGLTLRTAGHFNLPDTIVNPRSGEFGLVPDRAESALLNLDLCWIEPQDDNNIQLEFEVARALPDTFGDGYRSLANLCHQLRSLHQLWSLLLLLGVTDGDLVLLLRPDLIYLDAIEPEVHFRPLLEKKADLIVPGWQSWGGLNDRLAFCTRHGAEIYATRLQDFIGGCVAMDGMHSETFLKFIVQRAGLQVCHTSLRAARVRANGTLAGNDAELLRCPGVAQPEIVGKAPTQSSTGIRSARGTENTPCAQIQIAAAIQDPGNQPDCIELQLCEGDSPQ